MGKIKQGILGGFSGKVAGVVGSSWKGIAVMKALPLSVANPRTAGQVAQRNKFSFVVAFAGIILSAIIKPLWDRFASGKSGYNEFISTNIDLFDAELPSPIADLVISKGKMAATPIGTLSGAAAQKIVDVPWTDDSGAGFKLATDIPFLVYINATTGEIGGIEYPDDRASEFAAVAFSENLESGDVIHVYLAFRRADGTVVSNTSYATYTVA